MTHSLLVPLRRQRRQQRRRIATTAGIVKDCSSTAELDSSLIRRAVGAKVREVLNSARRLIDGRCQFFFLAGGAKVQREHWVALHAGVEFVHLVVEQPSKPSCARVLPRIEFQLNTFTARDERI
jgi:hypothetical protein